MANSSYIEYHRFQRNESCTEEGCRARRFYIEDGKKFCQRGHEQVGFTQTQEDEDDWNAQGKKSRRKRIETAQAARALSGREASELYLQCYQLILWKQCHWFVTVQGFPPEFETAVRDLWSLRVGTFQPAGGEKSGYSSGAGFSSTSNGDNADSDASESKSWASRRIKLGVIGKNKLPKLIETLALCYLGIMLLRLPISLGELYQWAANDELPYSHAIKEVPKDMKTRLPAHFHSSLEIRAPLNPHNLQLVVSRLFQFYKTHYEMEFPPLSAPRLIFKHMVDLRLPVEIYGAVQNLASILGYDFTYSTDQKAYPNHPALPEIQLMSLVVIAVKLSHPFDDISRIPQRELDPATLMMDWNKWRHIMASSLSNASKPAEHVQMKDTDVLSMTPEKMDEYLDWYGRTWTGDRDPQMSSQILELFPLPALSPPNPAIRTFQQKLQNLIDMQRNLITPTPQPSECHEAQGFRQQGDLYKRYRTVDELPENATFFFELAAVCAGTSVSRLIKSVLHIETRLGNWQSSERKRRLAEDG